MANIQSAKKRSRQANSRNSLKSSQRASMRTMIRNVEDAIKENDATKAKDLFISTQKVLDKLANKKVLPKNAVARQKSRFCLLYTSPSPRDVHLSRMPSSA